MFRTTVKDSRNFRQAVHLRHSVLHNHHVVPGHQGHVVREALYRSEVVKTALHLLQCDGAVQGVVHSGGRTSRRA